MGIRIKLTLMLQNAPTLYTKKLKFSGDHAVTMTNRVEVNTDIEPHGHDFFEIALAGSGNGGHISANGVQLLSGGNLIIIRPGAWHGYTLSNDLVIYNCCIDQQILDREISWLREDAAYNYLLWSGPYMSDRRGLLVLHLYDNGLEECLQHWHELDQVQASPRRADTIGRLLILLECLIRSIKGLDHLKQQSRPMHAAVLETMRMMESQIDQAWCLSDLAEQSHLNPSYLVRLFNAEVGLSPIAYLNHCRMERSAGLLLHTTFPVSEVAAQVGWFDANLFARRFRIAYGMSPSDYRKRFGESEVLSEPMKYEPSI